MASTREPSLLAPIPEYVDGGNGYHVGIGTWKVVRGTGQYAQITGGGRSGTVWLDRGPWSFRSEGFLILP